jgi:IS1 family transposase
MPAVIDTQTRNYIIHGLAEGLSIRSLERIFGTDRETIMRYQMLVGKGCHYLMDAVMRNLDIEAIQVDEFWSYIYKKQARVNRRKKSGYDHEGDIWTYVALDPVHKLVPCYWVGHRDMYDSRFFMEDLASRLKNRIQLSSDGLASYRDAVDRAFGSEIDYGMVVKIFSAPPADQNPTRGVTGDVVEVRREVISGNPMAISTSLVEKQNHTARMHIRRISRATNAFSKKLVNFRAAISLHFCYYNLCKRHITIGTTPAVAAGVTDHIWGIPELIENAALSLPAPEMGL